MNCPIYKNTYFICSLPAPVDKLLYLNARTEKYKRTEAAILVSSEGGILRFWSIYYSKHQQGIHDLILYLFGKLM